MTTILSKAWFGIVTNENDMSATYRKLLDFKSTSYTIVGKLRDNNDDMILIKFLLIFEEEVDFNKVTRERYTDVFNTILPIEPSKINDYIDLIKKITFLQSGIDPVTKFLIDDERYYSSDDSEYRGSSEEEEEEEEDDEDEDEEENEEQDDNPEANQRSCQPTIVFFWLVIITLFAVNYSSTIISETQKIVNQNRDLFYAPFIQHPIEEAPEKEELFFASL
jgi:hypothetical protein